MSKQQLLNTFEKSIMEEYKNQYAREVTTKHIKSTVLQENSQRTARHPSKDWAAVMHRGDTIHRQLAFLMDKPPHSREVQVAIGEWRAHITSYYYDCTLEIFRGLGDLYVEDKRFMANIDKYRPGLAKFMRKAMIYYCKHAVQEGNKEA